MAKSHPAAPSWSFTWQSPPRRGDRGQDFRTLPGQERFNPELDALVRDIKARQGLIRSMLEDDRAEPLGLHRFDNDGSARHGKIAAKNPLSASSLT